MAFEQTMWVLPWEGCQQGALQGAITPGKLSQNWVCLAGSGRGLRLCVRDA